ncbi:hypothetical protein KIW84_057839 [Lathyrus oleraceus]|uniref:Uncharacterized protein n=1 Tax=Pisum sativum TaxID=3888 RepID=A0A9D4X4E2_PEA|nr:hypothetical protein KIW84_057839 [Pisum sativum]
MDVIKEYDMESKKNIYSKKNDGKRMVVKCIKGWSFTLGLVKGWEPILAVDRWSVKFLADQTYRAKRRVVELIKGVAKDHTYVAIGKKYPGMELKETMWSIARATIVHAFEREMLKMKALDEVVWKEMKGVPS